MNRSIIVKSTIVVTIVGLLVWVFFGKQVDTTAVNNAAIVSVIVPDLPSELQLGKDLFDTKCADCHGANAAGKNGKGPPLVHIIYEPNHHPDESFALAAKNGTQAHHWPFGNMPPVANISNSELVEIINYVRHLQRANGIGVTQK